MLCIPESGEPADGICSEFKCLPSGEQHVASASAGLESFAPGTTCHYLVMVGLVAPSHPSLLGILNQGL